MNTRTILGFALGPITAAAMSLITVPAIAWAFTTEDVGRMNIMNVAVSFSVLLFSMGLDVAYVREYHETLDQGALLKTCFLPGLIILAILVLPSLALSHTFSYWLYGISGSIYFWMTLVCIVAAFASRFLSLILRMQERGIAFSLSQIIPKAVFLLVIGSIMLGGLSKHFIQLQSALVTSTCTVLFVFAWNTRKQWKSAWGASITYRDLRNRLNFSIPLVFASLAYWGLTATSALMLRSFSTFNELGIYAVSTSVASVAVIVQSIFAVIWAPIVYRWVAQGADMSRVDRIARQGLALVVAIFITFGLLSWLLDYVLPRQYVEVKYLVLCSIAQPLLYMLAEVTCVGINITRRTMLSFWTTLLALFVNLGLNVLLVPELGASGAVIANAIAFLTFFVSRTEASIFVWRSMPRFKLYFWSSAAVAMSVLTVLVGPNLRWSFSFVWLATVPLIVWAFRDELRVISGDLKRAVSDFRTHPSPRNAR